MWSFYADHVPDYPFFRLMGPSSTSSEMSPGVEGGPGHHLGTPPIAHSTHSRPDLLGLPPPPSSQMAGIFVSPHPISQSAASPTLPRPGRVDNTSPVCSNNHLGVGVPPLPLPPGTPPSVGSGLVNNSLSVAGLIGPPGPSSTASARRTIKSYHCKICDQMFDNKSDSLLHNQTVHKADPKPYRCSSCSKTFANSSYLSQHSRIHAGVKPYKCQICERRFTQLCHLQQHIRTHTGEKPYSCRHPGCAKAFSQLSNLQSHSRSHMTDRPFRCNSCYKCFSDEQSLREHIPKHTSTKHLKTHICRVCGKSYTQETYLARHVTKHQGVDPSANMLNLRQQPQQQQQQMPAYGGGGGGGGQQSPCTPVHLRLSPPATQPHLTHSSSQPSHLELLGSSMDAGRLPVSLADLPDIKPLLEGAAASLFESHRASHVDQHISKGSSSFIPLAHQFSSPAMMNSTSSFPFPPAAPPRGPLCTSGPGSSPLSAPVMGAGQLTPPLNSQNHHPHHNPYFPFDAFDFPPKRSSDTLDGHRVQMPPHNAGALASNLLRLSQIRQFNSSHPVFPKGEPARREFLASPSPFNSGHSKDFSKDFNMHRDFS